MVGLSDFEFAFGAADGQDFGYRRQRFRDPHLDHLFALPCHLLKPEFGRERKLTRTLTAREYGDLLRAADDLVQVNHGDVQRRLLAHRDQAMIWLLCSTALRVGELVAVSTPDVNINEGIIRVNGKGGKGRLAFLVDGDRIRLQRYMEARRKIVSQNEFVFVNSRGRQITTEGVRGVVTRLSKVASITRHITPHMLRHTAATRLLENGANLRVVQEFLGHATIRSTERYTHVSANVLRETVRSCSPLRALSRRE